MQAVAPLEKVNDVLSFGKTSSTTGHCWASLPTLRSGAALSSCFTMKKPSSKNTTRITRKNRPAPARRLNQSGFNSSGRSPPSAAPRLWSAASPRHVAALHSRSRDSGTKFEPLRVSAMQGCEEPTPLCNLPRRIAAKAGPPHSHLIAPLAYMMRTSTWRPRSQRPTGLPASRSAG